MTLEENMYLERLNHALFHCVSVCLNLYYSVKIRAQLIMDFGANSDTDIGDKKINWI